MQQTEPTFEIKMSFSRKMIQTFRKRYPAESIEESVHKAFETLEKQAGPGVHVSEQAMREMATILASPEVTSETELLGFARERFNIAENQVLLDIDPNLCYYIREVAELDGISFGTAVSNYLHQAFAAGWFNQYLRDSWVCFSQREWKRMREILGKVPTTGINLLLILEDWKVRREAANLPMLPAADTPPVHPELSKPKEDTAVAIVNF